MAVRRRKSVWGKYMVHLSVLLIVIVWTVPTFGILVSSFRGKDEISVSGWWTALTTAEQNVVVRTNPPSDAVEEAGKYVISGNLLEGDGRLRPSDPSFGQRPSRAATSPIRRRQTLDGARS